MTWNNADGLFVKFGAEEGVKNAGGSYRVENDGTHLFEVILRAADLGTAPVIVGEGALVEKGSQGVFIP
jgi:hypothetical protein